MEIVMEFSCAHFETLKCRFLMDYSYGCTLAMIFSFKQHNYSRIQTFIFFLSLGLASKRGFGGTSPGQNCAEMILHFAYRLAWYGFCLA